jgi:hypothetical protein
VRLVLVSAIGVELPVMSAFAASLPGQPTRRIELGQNPFS